jgi:ribosomal protein L21E
MRRTITLLAAGLLLAGTAVGCSSDSDKPTVTKATGSSTASSTPSPSPSPTPDTYKLGDTVDIDADTKFSTAALSIKTSGIAGVPGVLKSGQKWTAVEVKVCNTDKAPIVVTPFVWQLAYEDGARFEATSMSGGDFPSPLYPVDAKVRGWDCVRGHVLFEVPKTGEAQRVLYSPDALDEPVEWQLAK